MRHAQPSRAEVRYRRREVCDHKGQEYEREEIPEQPQEAKQDRPNDEAPIALIELAEAERGHAR